MAEDRNDKEYDLYTEHIVKEPWKNIKRRMKKGLLVMTLAIFFGLIAGLIMLVVYKVGKNYIDDDRQYVVEKESDTTSAEESESDTKETESVTIAPVETEVVTTEPPTELEIDDDTLKEYADYYKALKTVTSKVKKSMVTVTVSRENIDWFNTTYQNISEEYGLVISADDEGYYVLTDYSLVRSPGSILITYPDGSFDTATFLAGDTTTNLAVIKTATMDSDSVNIAMIADSGAVRQGDMILAVGKLYGFASSMGYGMATGVENIVNDTDSAYRLINTDILGSGNPTGVISNLKGEIAGIITTSYNSGNSSLINAYAISDIALLLERLSNGNTTPYLGIKGQEVTNEIKEKYEIPDGIYVTAVETNSPAYRAGIQTGDVISVVNEKNISTMNELMTSLGDHKVNDDLNLIVKRKGRDEYKEIEFNLVLGVE